MEERLLYFSAVLFAGITAQWLAWRFKLPSILLLLAFGFIGGLIYDAERILEDSTVFAVVSLSVAIIMLEGGLTLKIKELREAGIPALRLVSVGALITWLLASVAAHFLAAFSWPVAFLVGSLVVVTGPTVIGPLLRAVKPKKPVGAILKWEGIVIDPVGAVLAVLVFGALFSSNASAASIPTGIGKTLLVGVGLGGGAAYLLLFVLSRHWIPDFLHSVVILAAGIALFAISNVLQSESGLLTVTLLGIILTNQSRAQVRHIIEFKENLGILLISSLFIVLGGRIGIDDLAAVWKEAALFLLVLIVIVRPLSVYLSTLKTRLTWQEKLYLALMAPRGIVAAAVSAIFALRLAESSSPYAHEAARIVPVVYTVIVGTVAFYGLLAGPLARYLKLAVKNPQGILFAGIRPWSIAAAQTIMDLGFRVLMVDSNYAATAKARMAGVPAVNANILSDYAVEELDLSGIGRLLSATTNDSVNSMACVAFAHSLGRANLYQLAPSKDHEGARSSMSAELTGRILFDTGVHSTFLAELEKEEIVFKKIKLTETFDVNAYREKYGNRAIIQFLLRETGDLIIPTVENPPQLKINDTVIALILKEEEPT